MSEHIEIITPNQESNNQESNNERRYQFIEDKGNLICLVIIGTVVVATIICVSAGIALVCGISTLFAINTIFSTNLTTTLIGKMALGFFFPSPISEILRGIGECIKHK